MCEMWDTPTLLSASYQGVRVQSRAPLTGMSTHVAVRNFFHSSLRHTCIILLPLGEPEVTRTTVQAHQ